jgi:DNA invertase Pin-like site-specific DNA recombinase
MLVTKPSTKVAMYVRVSTQQQTTENQLLELYEVCERNDWTVVDEYNETVSGTKGVSERSELHRMLKDASRKKFDKVVVWSVDRVGRSMKHLVSVLSQLKDLDVDIYSYKQGIDTSTTMGSSFFHMVGIFSELENNMRRERQVIGIKRALRMSSMRTRNMRYTD